MFVVRGECHNYSLSLPNSHPDLDCLRSQDRLEPIVRYSPPSFRFISHPPPPSCCPMKHLHLSSPPSERSTAQLLPLAARYEVRPSFQAPRDRDRDIRLSIAVPHSSAPQKERVGELRVLREFRGEGHVIIANCGPSTLLLLEHLRGNRAPRVEIVVLAVRCAFSVDLGVSFAWNSVLRIILSACELEVILY